MAIRKKLVGSEQQKEIWDAMTMRKENLLVTARAGTGKTTTMIEGLWQQRIRIGDKVASVAFGRDAAKDLKMRVPPLVQAMTLHGLGYRAVQRIFPDMTMNKYKLTSIMRHINMPQLGRAFRSFTRMIDLVKSYVPSQRILPEVLRGIILRHGLVVKLSERFRLHELVEWTTKILDASTDVEQFGIDYSDMVWLPTVIDKVRRGLIKYDTLVVDETQDLNEVQRVIVFNSFQRLIAVGDEFQSIYGFRGADTESMPTLRGLMSKHDNGLIELPLTVSRRCPQVIPSMVNHMVPDFQVMPTAKPGIVGVLDPLVFLEKVDKGHAVLCRFNAPLVKLYYTLIAKGKKAYIRGRDIASSLMNMLEDLEESENENPTCRVMLERLEVVIDDQKRKVIQKGGDGKQLAELDDKFECLNAILRNSPNRRLSELTKYLEAIFKDQKNEKETITLSSIHKAKGLEYGVVHVLEPDGIPCSYAVDPWEVQQEFNLAYVLATRTKDQIYGIGGLPAIIAPREVSTQDKGQHKAQSSKDCDASNERRAISKPRRTSGRR